MSNALDQVLNLLSSELLLNSLKDVVSADTLYFIAQMGNGVGPEVYDTIPADMKKAPSDLKSAYGQAYFYNTLAIRRALRLEDENKITSAPARILFQNFGKLAEESKVVDRGVSSLCNRTGFGCPVQSPSQVLDSTIRAVQAAKLPSEDNDKIVSQLRSNRTKLMVNRSLPWLVLVGVGAAAFSVAGKTMYLKGSAS